MRIEDNVTIITGAARGIGRMSEIRVGSKTIAASACLHSEWKIDYFINAFDDAYRHCSPTKLLIRFMTEYALNHQRDFDFCVTVADYKREWPIEIRSLRTRTLYLTAFGCFPSPREVTNGARKTLASLRRHMLQQAAALGRRVSARRSPFVG